MAPATILPTQSKSGGSAIRDADLLIFPAYGPLLAIVVLSATRIRATSLPTLAADNALPASTRTEHKQNKGLKQA